MAKQNESSPCDEAWDRKRTADFLGVSISKLDHDRLAGIGPVWCRLGRAVRYRRLDVEAYIEAQKVGGQAK